MGCLENSSLLESLLLLVEFHKLKFPLKLMQTVFFKCRQKIKERVKPKKITITAEKGRLSEEEIERMVREAEEFAEEDKKVKERIDARNGLESYLYNLITL